MSDSYLNHLPARPSLPILFTSSWILILGLRYCLLNQVQLNCLVLGLFLVLVIGLYIYLRCNSYTESKYVLLVISLLISLIVGSISVGRAKTNARILNRVDVSQLELVVVSHPNVSRYNQSYKVKAKHSAIKGSFYLKLITTEDLLLGQTIKCKGQFKPLLDNEYSRGLLAQNCLGSIKVFRLTSIKDPRGLKRLAMLANLRVLSVIKPNSSNTRALTCACVCGSRQAFNECGLNDTFSRCGASHLVSVSGTHLMVLITLIELSLSKLNLFPKTRLVIIGVTSCLFVLMCGCTRSSVRAWAMCIISLISLIVGRRTSGLASLGVVGIVMCICNPYVACELGFVLSMSAVSGLCIYSNFVAYKIKRLTSSIDLEPLLHYKVYRVISRIVDYIISVVSASLVAILSTLPFSLPCFKTLSLIAPISNLFIAPIFFLYLPVSFVACAVYLIPPLSWFLFVLSDFLASLLIGITSKLSSLRFACVEPRNIQVIVWVSVGLLVVMYVRWSSTKKKLIGAVVGVTTLVALSFFVYWSYLVPARMCVLDIGQGDAIVFQERDKCVLIDTGPPGYINQALSRNHIRHIDAVIITHLHDDHYAGLIDMVGNVDVDKVYLASGVSGYMPPEMKSAVVSLTGSMPEELKYKDVLKSGNFTFKMIWPTKPVKGTTNPDSICMDVVYDTNTCHMRVLTTGDAEEEEIKQIVRNGDIGCVDVLKVGHHGSEVSIDEGSAKVIKPTLSVCSCGYNNEYGHPKKRCVDNLEAVGSKFICTKDVGDIYVKPRPDGIGFSVQNKEYLEFINKAA